MTWWEYVVVAAVLLAGIYGFLVLTGYVTRFLSSGTDRTADSMYDNYADSLHKQRRYATKHGGQWHDDETRSSGASQPAPLAKQPDHQIRRECHRPSRPGRHRVDLPGWLLLARIIFCLSIPAGS